MLIQLDSLLLWKVLEGKWIVPWIITELIAEIKECMYNIIHIFQHILREDNQLADFLGNKAIDKGSQTYL